MKFLKSLEHKILKTLVLYMTCHACIAQVPTTGLVAHYPFNSKMVDVSTNANQPLLGTNLEPAEDRFGNAEGAYRFNGKNSYISVPNSTSLQSPQRGLSICGWIKLEAKNANYDINIPLLTKGGASGTKAQYRFVLQRTFGDSYSTISISSDLSGKDQTYLQHAIDFDKWYFIAVTTEDEWVYVYLNGKLIWQTINTKTFTANDSPVEIGRDAATGKYFSGCLDDLRIYKNGLSANEVLQLYKDESGKNFLEEVPLIPSTTQQRTYNKAVAITEETKQPSKAVAIAPIETENRTTDVKRAELQKDEESKLAIQKMEEAKQLAAKKDSEEKVAAKKLEDERKLALQKEEERKMAIQKMEEAKQLAAKKVAEEKIATQKLEEERKLALQKEEERKLAIQKMEEAKQMAAKKDAEEKIAAQKMEDERRLALQKEEERKLAIQKMEEAKQMAVKKDAEEKIAAQKVEEERKLALQKEEERRLAIQKLEEEQKLALKKLEEEQRLALQKLEQERQLALKKLEDERQIALKKITDDSPIAEQSKATDNKLPAKEQKQLPASPPSSTKVEEERKFFLQKMEEARKQYEAEQRSKQEIKEVREQKKITTTSTPTVEKKTVDKLEQARNSFEETKNEPLRKIEAPVEKPVAYNPPAKRVVPDSRAVKADKKSPIFNCPKDTTIYLPHNRRGVIYNYTPPTATDNVGIDSIWQTLGTKSGCFLQLGVHPFTFYAVDYAGNQNFCTHSVILKEDPGYKVTSAPTVLNEVIELGDDTIQYEHKAQVKDCRLTVYIYDDGEQDNDTVSIIFNGEVIVSRQMIKLKENGAIKRELALIPDTENYLVAKAWNTGRYGLNTLRIDVYEGIIENDKKDLKGVKTATSKVLHSKPGTAGGMLLKCD